MPTLEGRTAIVTGASRRRGLGFAIARALAADGANLCLARHRAYDRTQSWYDATDCNIDAMAAEIGTDSVRVVSFDIDLSRPDGAAELFHKTRQALGTVHVLVNNAAYSIPGGIDRLDAATLDAHYAVNLRAVSLLSAEFARQFDQPTGGRIVNLTSGQGVTPMPNELAYAATKGAVDALTTSLSAALADKGITVNAVDPGATDTGWIDPNLERTLLATAPMGRLGQPEDAARLVAFLASDDAAWITGQVIRSRGGA
ncbi:MAG: SDR family oxidoreductase [Pseudomonadota bacterium]